MGRHASDRRETLCEHLIPERPAGIRAAAESLEFRCVGCACEFIWPPAVPAFPLPPFGYHDAHHVSPAEMGHRVRPPPVACILDQAGADGVLFDRADCLAQMRAGHVERVEAELPQVADDLAFLLELHRLPLVGTPKRPVESFLCLGNGNPVNMVRHQAVGAEPDPVFRSAASDQAEVLGSVLIGQEDVLPVVAPLRDVMPAAGDDDSLFARHAETTIPSPPDSFQNGACHHFRRKARLRVRSASTLPEGEPVSRTTYPRQPMESIASSADGTSTGPAPK